ncbi:MAG: 4-hydroxybenzoate polyprenyltransferase [Epsilonproteobacteria bacterium]|nr:4-hydroxybenzoate polyprenyltransferase [Campylobacterota bacterium]
MVKKLVRDFSELVMFQHTIFSLPFIFIAMIVAADGWFGWRLLFLGLLAAVSARNFAMGVNRYLDRDIDALNPRTASRPSVDGRIDPFKLRLFILLNGLLFIGVAFLINELAFWLSFPILLVLAAYSYWKRFSELAHLFLGLSLGLAPIAGAVAVLGSIPLWSIFLALGVLFWVAGFDLLYSLQDMEFDRRVGLYSIPARYGLECTLFLSRLFHGLAMLFWLFFIVEAQLGPIAYLGWLLAGGMLIYEQLLVAKGLDHIDRAFFTVNGYLGFILLIAIGLDRIFG